MKVTKTNWYSGDQKPVRIGVYEREYWHGFLFCYWNGEYWERSFETAHEGLKREASIYQDLPWRGVTKKTL